MATIEWGVQRDMSAMEAIMWRAEHDPRLRSTIVAIEILEHAPDWDRFLAAHDWATRMVPRFRQRVAEPALGLGQPTWVVDERFDLGYHVQRVALPEGNGMRELLDLAQGLAMRPFDRGRPPWEAVLFEGLPDGRAGYVLKLHHSATDGIGAIQLLAALQGREPEPDPDKPQPDPPATEPWSAVGELARQATRDVRLGIGALRGAAGAALGGVLHPDRLVRDTAELGASLRRVLGDPGAAPSPLLEPRSHSWRFEAFDVEFADLRSAGKAAGGTMNDAFLAALLGGFRRYHEELDCPLAAMPIAIPISVRRPGDRPGGNRFAAARLAGPLGIVDARERIRAIGELVHAARGEAALEGIGLIAPALARLPAPLVARLTGGMARGNDLQASNVPGIREDAYLAGVRVERIYPFPPLPGCAAMVALLTHGDTCCVGANLDTAAITDPDRFARCLVEGFGEVLSLHPGAAPAVHRT